MIKPRRNSAAGASRFRRERRARARAGGVYQLSAALPVGPGRTPALLDALEVVASGVLSPFAAIDTTHFARLVLLEHLGSSAPGAAVVPLDPPRLLLAADLDGEPDAWLEQLAAVAGGDGAGAALAEVFGCCAGWPGPSPESFVPWVRRFEIEPILPFASYRASAAEIRAGVAAHRQLSSFAAAAQHLGPSELRAAWREAFGW